MNRLSKKNSSTQWVYYKDDSFWTRQNKLLKEKVKKTEKLKSERAEKELSECTFAPRTSFRNRDSSKFTSSTVDIFARNRNSAVSEIKSNNSKENQKDFKKFLNNQKEYEAKRIERLNRYKKEKETESLNQVCSKPQISRVSSELVLATREEKMKKNIHNRLYEDSKIKQEHFLKMQR